MDAEVFPQANRNPVPSTLVRYLWSNAPEYISEPAPDSSHVNRDL